MSTMVGAPRTPACRRADQDREAHGTAARRQWDAARVHRPQNVTAGPSLSLRHAGTVSASGRADQPAATATKSTP